MVPRAIGNTWQAAYDARMFTRMHHEKIDYVSQWMFTTRGIWEGIPSVSQQVALLVSRMAGARAVEISPPVVKGNTEIGALSAYRKEENKLYLLFYAYSDSVYQNGVCTLHCVVNGLNKQLSGVRATSTLVSDDSNFFDEWEADRVSWGVSDKDFGWSSGSYVIGPPTLTNAVYLDAFQNRSHFYQSCARLRSVSEPLPISDGRLSFTFCLPHHGVILYELEL